MVTTDQIKDELRRESDKKSSTIKNLAWLAITLFLFFSFGLFTGSVTSILIIILVLVVHELGHLAAMRFFGYRDLKMFFIPLFGAAVSGKSEKPSSFQQAIVSLMGPVPGIIIGLIFAGLYFSTQNELFSDCARIFLFINGFNLLPFFPLDGGRVLETVLFVHRPKAELIFKLFAGIALIAIAWELGSFPLGILSYFVFVSTRAGYMQSVEAKEIRNSLEDSSLVATEEIPDEHLQKITATLNAKVLFNNDNAKMFASHARSIWEKVCSKPTSARMAFGLTGLYLIVLIVGVGAPFGFEVAKAIGGMKTSLVEEVDEHGKTKLFTVLSQEGAGVISKTEINKEGFYHGIQTRWYWGTEQKESQGSWKDGFWDGEWTFWDREGNIRHIGVYEMGVPKKFMVYSAGSLVEKPEEQWPLYFRTKQEKVTRTDLVAGRMN